MILCVRFNDLTMVKKGLKVVSFFVVMEGAFGTKAMRYDAVICADELPLSPLVGS